MRAVLRLTLQPPGPALDPHVGMRDAAGASGGGDGVALDGQVTEADVDRAVFDGDHRILGPVPDA
ncbi:MAG: hypothetical protein R2845_12790 [Thermomicrobiales bacterium]